MIIYDGTYLLERKADPGADRLHACAWRVKIIDLSSGSRIHRHIRPIAVLACRHEGGIFKASCAESMGKRICTDFNLTVEALLWVEAFADHPNRLYVAVFTPLYHGEGVDYRVSWRPILENERAAIAPWCP